MNVFEISNVRSNPLLVRAMRKPTRFSASTILLSSMVICVTSVLLSIVAVLMRREIGAIRLILVVWGLIVISIPPFLASLAAQLTYREVTASNFELLHLTTLSNAQLVQGLLFSSLYKCRGWLLIMAGIVPVLLLLATYMASYNYEGLVNCLMFKGTGVLCPYTLPTKLEIVIISLNSLILLVNLSITILFSVMLGLALAVWWRLPYVPNYVAALSIAVFSGIFYILTIMRPVLESIENNVLLFFLLLLLLSLSYFIAYINIRKPT